MPISTAAGVGLADELAFGDVDSGRILVANPNEPTVAVVTLVNTASKTIIGKVLYDEAAHSGLPTSGHGFNTNFGFRRVAGLGWL